MRERGWGGSAVGEGVKFGHRAGREGLDDLGGESVVHPIYSGFYTRIHSNLV